MKFHIRIRNIARAAPKWHVGISLFGLALVLSSAPTIRAEPKGVTDSPSVLLGAMLFSDTNLSADRSVSCASCHRPELAFSDGKKRSIGVFGQQGTRNAPSLLDVSLRPNLFWDGRRGVIDDLVLDPIMGRREHGLRSEQDLLARVSQSNSLSAAYVLAFGRDEAISTRNIALALTSYLDTLHAKASPFQQFVDRGADSLNFQQKLGYELFVGRAGCSICHRASGEDFRMTDDSFHNRAVGDLPTHANLSPLITRAMKLNHDNIGETILADPEVAALGRFVITRKATDIGAFRTPPLYNVAITAPYMHDGSLPTLVDAVEHEIYYSMPDHGAQLEQHERYALVAFLESLTSVDMQDRSKALKKALSAP